MVDTELARLLAEAFPAEANYVSVASSRYASVDDDCWVRRVFARDTGNYADEISVVTRCGGRKDLVQRLQTEHPKTPDHNCEDRMRDVFTEVGAYAWAVDVAGLGTPKFQLKIQTVTQYCPPSPP